MHGSEMSRFLRFLILPVLSTTVFSGEKPPAAPADRIAKVLRTDGWALDVETSVTWRMTDLTGLDYVVVPTVISLRTPAHFRMELEGNRELVLRSRFSLLGEWIARGPESHYFGISGSPSIEYWYNRNTYAHFSIGGGLGVIDSRGVEGGQGQDLTYNWFISLGVRHYFRDNLAIGVGLMYQHMSNLGATDPNPGLDVFGPMAGISYSW